jgi:hypothetical protein
MSTSNSAFSESTEKSKTGRILFPDLNISGLVTYLHFFDLNIDVRALRDRIQYG